MTSADAAETYLIPVYLLIVLLSNNNISTTDFHMR